MRIIIPSIDEIIEINKRLGGETINRGGLDFLITKIESKHADKDLRKQIAKISAILWMDIIQKHPFMDGNKRAATEAVMLFLQKNKFVLETPLAGKVYVSLSIANNEMRYEDLVKWIYGRLKGVKS